MNLNEIYNLDCRDGLKQMISENIKVDTVISSPPYWNLRDYGIESGIWDGDSNCDHDFNLKIFKGNYGGQTGFKNSDGYERKTRLEIKDQLNNSKTEQGFCSKCGAWKGILGLEPNFELFIKHLCDIYDLIWDVLNDYGTNWVNLGDNYGGSGNSSGHTTDTINLTRRTSEYGASKGNQKYTKGFEKSLLMIPQRFTIEMINRGWILRNVIIWQKPNPMPSSARDRFTVDFEYLFFFVKNKKHLYWVNQKTLKLVSEKPLGTKGSENIDWRWVKCSKCKGTGKNKETKEVCNPCKGLGKKRRSNWEGKDYYFKQQFEPVSSKKATQERYKYKVGNQENRKDANEKMVKPGKAFSKYFVSMRNKRAIWNIPTKPCKEAHFATFPDTLVKIPIKAGCPRFVCNKCGKPIERIYEDTEAYQKLKEKWKGVNLDGNIKIGRNRKTGYPGHISRDIKFIGFSDCGCDEGIRAGIVLDPFAGISTTLLSAWRLGRDFIGFEISEEYFKISKRKLAVTKNSRLEDFGNQKNKEEIIEV